MGDNILDIITAKMLQRKHNNAEQIKQYDEKMRMARVNTFEWKFGVSCVFGMLAFLVLFIAVAIICKCCGREFFTNIMHPFAISGIIVALSAIAGFTCTCLMQRHYHSKERFKKVSDAKTYAEKLEYEIVNEVGLEQLKQQNQIYDKTTDAFQAKQAILEQLSEKYNISEKDQLNKDELNDKYKELQNIATKLYKTMDKLVAQKVLATHFQTLSSPLYASASTLGIACVAVLVILILLSISLIFAPSGWMLMGTTPRLITTLSIMGVTFACGIWYGIHKTSTYRKVYNNIIANLPEIEFKPIKKRWLDEDTSEAYAVDLTLKEHIKDVVAAEIQLQEIEMKMIQN